MLTDLFTNLKRDPKGFWTVDLKQDKSLSYPENGNQECYQIEDHSFWFQHRNKVISFIYEKYRKNFEQTPFIDLGGGNGFVTKMFQEKDVPAILIEPGPSGALNATNRGLKKVICARWEDLETNGNLHSDIGLFDVLEHLEHPEVLLKNICSKITQDSYLFITVPAYQSLWSTEDSWAGHFRRYNRTSMHKLLNDSGFNLLHSSNFFSFLVLPIFFFRTLPFLLGMTQKIRSQQDTQNDHKESGRIFRFLSSAELFLFKKLNFSFIGTSIIVVAKKK